MQGRRDEEGEAHRRVESLDSSLELPAPLLSKEP